MAREKAPTQAPATKRRPGRPRADETGSSSTRDVILEVALREFAQNGFDGVSITEIARRSEVAKALVHYHFNNKENLWKAAVNYAFREMRAKFEDIPLELQDLDPVSFLKVFIRRYVYFVARRPELLDDLAGDDRAGTNDHRRSSTGYLALTLVGPAASQTHAPGRGSHAS